MQHTPRRRPTRVLLLVAAAVLAALPLTSGPVLVPSAAAAEAPTRTTGYVAVDDGTRLKWTLLSPGEGPHPVLVQYEGYNAGSNPARVNDAFVADALAAGYAVLGVSMRGTACSGGEFALFDPRWGTDGAQVVEWAADQPWSTGRVGLFSFSYAGISQLLVAAQRPEGLAAIAPGMVVSDMYRDVGYPGGIANAGFPAAWEAALHLSWAQAAQQAQAEGDAECLANIASHQVLGVPEGVVLTGFAHPYDDAFFRSRSPQAGLRRIDVPVLGAAAWQDEQTGPRGVLAFDRTDPDRTWVVGTNGIHGMYAASPRFRSLLLRFMDRWVKGERNGWESTPHRQLWFDADTDTFDPASVVTSRGDEHDVRGRTRALALGPDGALGARRATGSTSYATPLPSPGLVSEALVLDPSSYAGGLTWQTTPVVPGGSAAFTTAPLGRDTVLDGGSLDLWLRTTAEDADVQVTLTEVRPDGQETYVQRGWLRLSHRALSPRSTRLLPVHPHTAEAQEPMVPGQATRVRVALQPFAQVFRAGSRLRVWLDTPSVTGLWAFAPNDLPGGASEPSQVEVLHDAEHPSRLLVSQVRGPRGGAGPLPDCGTLVAQPCRPDPLG